MMEPVEEVPLTPVDALRLRQADLLARIDVSEHNRQGSPPQFDRLVSQAASAAQMDHPAFRETAAELTGLADPLAFSFQRKVWEWVYIITAIRQSGNLAAGKSAIGFGVGNEPLPAYFAAAGMEVLATDQGIEGATGSGWAETGQLMDGLLGLARPHLLEDAQLAERVTVRDLDMNHIPSDIGTYDVAWSSCVIEHLGSPKHGMDFVIESCKLLKPGGVAVHTTELELLPQEETRDYGHCAIFQIADLVELQGRLADVGCTADFNFYVSMDRPEDRWVSLILDPVGRDFLPDPSPGTHLKLQIGDSVSTSFGIFIAKNR